uniref:Reverse transcriptase n=1 Tax=Brugia pahangi TaxID=6280 RepID=A0A0N4TV99_BRUPA
MQSICNISRFMIEGSPVGRCGVRLGWSNLKVMVRQKLWEEGSEIEYGYGKMDGGVIKVNWSVTRTWISELNYKLICAICNKMELMLFGIK